MGQTLIDFAKRKLWAYIPGGFEFVSARDMVEGHMLCMEKGRPGQRYIFSTNFLSVDDMMAIMEQVTGHPRPKLRLPASLMAALAAAADSVLGFFPGLPRRFTPGAVHLLRLRRRVDCTKARSELGYQPTDIVAAFREAYDFFVQRGLISAGNSNAAVQTGERFISSGTPG
jgi:nucleoside-diphosphate-sugar epimerase